MGLFDLFRKPAQPAPARPACPAVSPLLEALTRRYALEHKPPAEDSIRGDWWESGHEGRLVAFQPRSDGLVLYLGEPAEVTEIYLVCASPDDTMTPRHALRQRASAPRSLASRRPARYCPGAGTGRGVGATASRSRSS
jgi:hypothetical protein